VPQPASSPKPPAVGGRWAHSPEAMTTTRALIHWSLTGTNPHPVRRRWMPVLARVPSDKWSIAAMAELYLLHFGANRPFARGSYIGTEPTSLPLCLQHHHRTAYSASGSLPSVRLHHKEISPLKERDPSSAAPLTEPADETHLRPVPYKTLMGGRARGYAAGIMLHGAQIGSYNTIYIFLAILEASRHCISIHNSRSWRPCTEKIAY